MSSATENYGRLKLLSERLVHPAAENVLETYLRSEKVQTISVFSRLPFSNHPPWRIQSRGRIAR
jgi:hypothetical protein